MKTNRLLSLFLVLAVVLQIVAAVPFTALAETYGDFMYTVTNGNVTITGYEGAGGDVVIPDTIEGYPVTEIGNEAFWSCTKLDGIYINNPTPPTAGENMLSL